MKSEKLCRGCIVAISAYRREGLLWEERRALLQTSVYQHPLEGLEEDWPWQLAVISSMQPLL